MNCVARVSDDGKSAEVWIGTQSNFLCTLAGAGVLKTTPNMITVHQQLLGGGFGRRIAPDAVAQAIALANATKQTGEADAHARGRPGGGAPAADDLPAAEGRPGRERPDRRLAPPHGRRERRCDRRAAALQGDRRQGPDRLARAWSSSTTTSRTCWPTGCASSAACACSPGAASARATPSSRPRCFLDEIAHATGKDPLALRLELAEGPAARGRRAARGGRDGAVDEAAAQGPRARHRVLRLPRHRSTAGIAEVSVDRKSGRIRVHNYWVAADAGLAVQPENCACADGERGGLRPERGADEELTVKAGVIRREQLPPVPRAAHERRAGDPHQAHGHRTTRRPAWARSACRRSRRRSPTQSSS